MRPDSAPSFGLRADPSRLIRRSAGLEFPLAVALRKGLIRLLSRLRHGSIRIDLPDGRRIERRGTSTGPDAAIALHRWRALGRLVLRGDLGLAESYRDGDWSTPDLVALMQFGACNQSALGASLDATWPVRLLARALHLARGNSRRGSRRNIAFHYDMGNAFYACWLDPELIYSSALYGAEQQSLESAQDAKLARVLELLRLDHLPEGSRVLEIGCGWGALALAIARRQGVHVTGITLSAQQLAHASGRVAQSNLGQQVELKLQDYRDVGGSYDRIVSIEMLEAVGERYWPAYFETIRRRLHPGGIAVIQVITIAEEDFLHYRRTTDFIQHFIFPGGMLPTESALHREAGRAGLRLHRQSRFGLSYARTLADWRRRFLASWPAIEALGFDASFRRLWEYYLCYCEAGFRSAKIDVGLYVLEHIDSGAQHQRPPRAPRPGASAKDIG